MKNHKFKYIETSEGGKKIYVVECNKTGGEFCTEYWSKGLVQQNLCPCCKEVIKK